MKKKGFTLVELMVTVTIMVIMTGVVLFNYNRFNENSILNAFAYDLSLTIRQAQVYGGATRGSGDQSAPINTSNFGGTTGSTIFNHAYGVHFDMGAPTSFIMFVDTNDNGTYDTDESLYEKLQSYSFQRGIEIRKLCYPPNEGNSNNCVNGANGVPGSQGKEANLTLDIMFKRPDPEAKIHVNTSEDLVSAATIYLQNADGTIIKSVTVYSTGQISVQ